MEEIAVAVVQLCVRFLPNFCPDFAPVLDEDEGQGSDGKGKGAKQGGSTRRLCCFSPLLAGIRLVA